MMPWPKDSTEKILMSAWQLTIKLPYDLIGFIKLCPGERKSICRLVGSARVPCYVQR